MAFRVFRNGSSFGVLLASKSKHYYSTSASTNKSSPIPSVLLKPVLVSPALANFIGASDVSRSDAVKKVWGYIKLHNLQDPTNKREIFCDEKLKIIFNGKEKVEFLEIARLLSNHFYEN